MRKIIHLLRIKQWIKNLICFSGVIFGGEIFNSNSWLLSLGVFICFCFTSSSIYILNDIIDRHVDSLHPKKKYRPIASGSISIRSAIIIGLINVSIGLTISWVLGTSTIIIVIIYLINNILYSNYFKKIPIVDVFSIAFGFILRMVSGIYIIGELPTSWIILCTMFLALFLGFSKRLSELESIKVQNDFKQRLVLFKYNEKSLTNLINETSFGSILSYSLFATVSGKNPSLIITVPIVYYAIIYYKQSLFNSEFGEEPDLILLTDKTILLCTISWLIMVVTIIYLNLEIFSY